MGFVNGKRQDKRLWFNRRIHPLAEEENENDYEKEKDFQDEAGLDQIDQVRGGGDVLDDLRGLGADAEVAEVG
jgi:hypothetical protein